MSGDGKRTEALITGAVADRQDYDCIVRSVHASELSARRRIAIWTPRHMEEGQLREPIVRIAAAAAMLFTLGCGSEMPEQLSHTPVPALSSVTPDEWNRLAERRLFFAHQSVGGNVLDGVAVVLREHPEIPLRVAEITDASQMQGPGLYHKRVGTNGKPATKLAEFERLAGAAFPDSSPGVAMLKYCYTDVRGDTDPVALFEEYRRQVDALRLSHPGLVVVHVTMPLWVDTGLIDHVGTLVLGKATPIRALNAARHRYNELLRQTYRGKEPFFDLADLESVRPDGSIADVRYQGVRVPALAREWTTDGGHLNDAARLRMAGAFLAILAKLP